MALVVTPTYTWLQGRRPVEAEPALYEALSYWVSEYSRWTRVWGGHRQSLVSEGAPGGIGFPTGLLDRALRAVAPWRPTIDDRRVYPPTPEAITRLGGATELYGDQVEAVATALRARVGLLDLAVNFGKTAVIAGILASFLGAGRTPSGRRGVARRALVIVNRQGLLTQTAGELEKFLGERVGQWGAGRKQTDRRVTVAMIQSLCAARRKPAALNAFLEAQDVLIVDECHVISSPETWMPILGACPALWRFGLSGSIKEAPVPMLMEAFFGPVLMEVRESALVEQGRSAQATVFMPYVTGLVSGDEYDEVYEAGVVRNEARHALVAEIVAEAARRGYRSAVLFYRLDHGYRLAALLRDRGVRVAILDGSTSPGAAQRAREDFLAHKLDVLVGSVVLNTGIDLWSIDLLCNAAAWRSPLATGQKLGRGLRRKHIGPNRVVVLDFYDTGHPLLERHAKERAKVYGDRGFPVHIGPWEGMDGGFLRYLESGTSGAPSESDQSR